MRDLRILDGIAFKSLNPAGVNTCKRLALDAAVIGKRTWSLEEWWTSCLGDDKVARNE
jgi:hypothetical protein